MILLNIFKACDGHTALEILLFLIIAALLGFLIRHFLCKGKYYKGKFEDCQKKYDDLSLEYHKYQSDTNIKLADKDKIIDELNNKIKSLEDQIKKLIDEKHKLAIDNTAKATNIVELHQKLNEFEKNNINLKNEKVKLDSDWNSKYNNLNETLNTEIKSRTVEIEAHKQKIAILELNVNNLKDEKNKLDIEWQAKYETLVEELKEALIWKTKAQEFENQINSMSDSIKKIEDEDTSLKNNMIEKNQYLSKLETRLTQSSKESETIPTLESEISLLKAQNEEEQYDIELFKSKIKELEDKLASLSSIPILSKPKKDDLTIVEGIGPKIQELLYKAGIIYFEQLANSSHLRLKKILEDAGDRFRMHDPLTWPLQADLAAKGKWDELKELQTRLDGGKY